MNTARARLNLECEHLQASNEHRCNVGNLRAVKFAGQFSDTTREQDYWAEAVAQSSDRVAQIEKQLAALN